MINGNIDERIVEMKFNNGQFERGIKESTKSLEKFQERLQFKEAINGTKDLERATNSLSFDGLEQSVHSIEGVFTSVFGRIKARVIDKFGDDIYSAGKKMVKSLTIDPIKTGWEKYADLTSAVQTIMNSVDNVTMDEVQGQLEMLSWYTDETSYHFSDMVSNIGKFTSSGQSLTSSVKAMIGIANACALAGAGAQKADIAMYNFSQALAAGKVTLLDWKSIGSTAGLSTKEFKTTVIETAKALGKLTKEGKTAKGTLVTFQNFEKTLSEGWYDKDVIIASLEKYGSFVEQAYALVQEGKAETAADAIKMITDEEYALGKKAFVAAQEAKTFKEAIESVQEAVASGWMSSFQIVFGNYEEAKVLWTDLANALWKVFASGAEARNNLLKAWADSDVNGRADALKAIYSILNTIWSVATAVGDAFRSMLPEITVDTLKSATADLMEFADKLDKTFSAVKRTIYAPIKEATQSLPILERFDQAMKLGAKGEGVKKLQERLMQLGYDVGEKGADGIWGPKTEAAFRRFQEETGKAVDGIYNKDDHLSLLQALANVQKPFEEEEIGTVVEYSDKLQQLRDIFSGIGAIVNIVRNVLVTFWNSFKTIAGAVLGPVIDVVLALGSALGKSLVSLDDWLTNSGVWADTFETIQTWVAPLAKSIRSAADAFLIFFGLKEPAEDSKKDVLTFQKVWESTKKSLKESGVIDAVTKAWESFKSSIASVKKTIIEYWEIVRKYLSDKFSGAVESASSWLPKVMATLGKGLSSALNFISGIISKIPKGFNKIKTFFTKLYNNLKSSDKIKSAGDKIKEAFLSIKNAFVIISPKIKEYWGIAKDWISEKFGDLFTKIADNLPDIIAKIGTGLSKAFSWVSNALKNVPSGVEKVGTFFSQLYEKVATSEKVQTFIENARTTLEAAWEGLKSIWNEIISIFSSDASAEAAEDSGGESPDTVISETLESAAETSENVVTVADSLSSTWDRIRVALLPIWNTISDLVKRITPFVPLLAFILGMRSVFKLMSTIFGANGVMLQALNKIYAIKTGTAPPQEIVKKGESFQRIASGILMLAGSIALIAASMWLIGNMDTKAFIKGSIAVGIITIVVVALTISLGKMAKDGQFGSFDGLARSIIFLGVTIALIGASLWIVGHMSWGAIIKGLLVFIVVALIMRRTMKSIGKISSKRGGASADIKGAYDVALGIAILGAALWIVGKLKFSEIVKGLIALWGCSLIMRGVVKSISKWSNDNGFKGVLKIAASIGILVGLMWIVGHMSWGTIEKGFVGLLGVVVILKKAMKALTTGNDVKAAGFGTVMLALFAMGLLIAEMYVVATLFNWDQLARGFLGMLGMVVVFKIFVSAFSSLGNSVKKLKFGAYLGVIGALVALAGLMYIFAVACDKIKGASWKNILAFSLGMSVMLIGLSLAMRIMGSMGVGGVVSGLIGLVGLFAVLGLVIAAAAALSSIPGFDDFMQKGAKSLGGLLGAFIGSITESMKTAEIRAFGNSVGSLQNLKSVDKDSVNNAIDIAQSISDFGNGLPDSGIVDRVLGWLGGSKLSVLSSDMAKFGEGFNSFATEINSIVLTGDDETALKDKTTFAISVASQISAFEAGLPEKSIGQTIASIFGASDLAVFSSDIGKFGAGFKAFADEIALLDNSQETDLKDKTTFAIDVASRIAEFEGSLSGYDSIGETVLALFGKSKFSQFSNDLAAFGESFNAFKDEILKLEIDESGELALKTTAAITTATLIHSFESSLGEYDSVGEVILALFGKSKFGQFSDDMPAFAAGFNNFTKEMKGIEAGDINAEFDEKVTKAIDVATQICALEAALPAESFGDKIITLLGGNSTFGQFSEDLPNFAGGMNTFATEMKKVEFDSEIDGKTTNAISLANRIVSFLQELKDVDIEKNKGELAKFFTGETTANTVFTQIGDLGTSIASASSSFSVLSDESVMTNIESAISILDSMIVLLIKAKDAGSGEADWNFTSAIAGVSLLADNVEALRVPLVGFEYEDFSLFAGGLHDLTSALVEVGQIKGDPIGLLESEIIGINDAISSSDWSIDTLAFVEKLNSSIDFTAFSSVGTAISDSIMASVDAEIALHPPIAGFNAINEWIDKFGTTPFNNGAPEKVGKYIDAGIARGIRANSGLVNDEVRLMVEGMLSVARSTARIASPSKEGIEIGMYFDLGIAQGLYEYGEDVSAASRKMMTDLIGGASSTAAAITSIINDDMDNQPVIRPVLDLSDISANAGRMNGLFGNRTIGLTGAELAGRVQTNANSIPVGSRSNFNTTEAIQSVNERLDNLGEAMTHMKVVMDSGVLAGEIAPKVDKNLGKVIARKGRG